MQIQNHLGVAATPTLPDSFNPRDSAKIPATIIANRSNSSSLARAYEEELRRAANEAERAQKLFSEFPTSENGKRFAEARERMRKAAARLVELGYAGKFSV